MKTAVIIYLLTALALVILSIIGLAILAIIQSGAYGVAVYLLVGAGTGGLLFALTKLLIIVLRKMFR